ncbi:MAG: hypothetical protein NTAFB01_09770 [Nitrospira sp.]
MKQGKSMSGMSRDAMTESGRNNGVILACLVAVCLLTQTFSQPVAAEPLVKVLFGNDTCTFLPERPAPSWVNKRPSTTDFVGVGSAPRMSNPTEQIQAAEQNARTALAAEIEVAVNETVRLEMEEKNRTTKTTTERESNTAVSLAAKQTVDQTLMGSRIEERWLDRENCIVHVMAIASQASVEDARKKLAERLRKLFKFKQLMLLDYSEAQGEMVSATRGHLEALFKQGGSKLVAADSSHRVCADDPMQPACQQPADIIYAGYKVVLDKEGATAEFKRRIYKLTGNVRFKDRLIASFDVACQGTGKIGQDYLIDQQAAKSCFDKAKPIIEKGMEGSE